MIWRKDKGKSTAPAQISPEARRLLYKRYFAFRRGFQAGAASLPHRVAPYEDYDQGYKLGRAYAVEVSARWLREHQLPDPTSFPYLPLPAPGEPTFPPLPEDAETIYLTREELDILDDVEIDVSDLVELHESLPRPATGADATGEGLFKVGDSLIGTSFTGTFGVGAIGESAIGPGALTPEGDVNFTLYGFHRTGLDTSAHDAPAKGSKTPRR